ncbi:MAG TPA: SPW repeat protein [Methylomirabilota bacterium]|nr:SPW repeat protein [Methylomirabilota bacterium]
MLVILQPVVVGEWCTLCLAAAGVMLLMIPLTLDEVVAMIQFMILGHREGKPLWRTFWVGDTITGGREDERTSRYGSPVGAMLPAMTWGVTVPWSLLASAGLGVWLMFSPAVFGTQAAAADSDHLVGALVLTIAVISMAEVVRAGRFLNVVLGAWLVMAPWLLAGASPGAGWNDVVVGAAVVVLSIFRGAVYEHYGEWDRASV